MGGNDSSKNECRLSLRERTPFRGAKGDKEEPRVKTYLNVDESLRDSKNPVTE